MAKEWISKFEFLARNSPIAKFAARHRKMMQSLGFIEVDTPEVDEPEQPPSAPSWNATGGSDD